jgi:hypothetical protein
VAHGLLFGGLVTRDGCCNPISHLQTAHGGYALHDHAWPTEISRGLLLVGLFEYFNYGIYSTRQSSLRTTMSMF